MSNNYYDKFEESIKRILNENIITKLIGNTLKIVENNSGASGKGITITNIKRSIPLGLDIDDRNIYFLNNTTKINDHTILYYKDKKLKVFLLELKSKKKRNVKEQLLIGKAYADFIINILKSQDVVIEEVEYRAIVFTLCKKGSSKQVTQRTHKFRYDWKENEVYGKELPNNKRYNFSEFLLPISE